MILPTEAASVLLPLAPAFTAPTFDRFVLLTLSAVLTTGRRTVANLLRTLGCLAQGHRTSYQRPVPGPLVRAEAGLPTVPPGPAAAARRPPRRPGRRRHRRWTQGQARLGQGPPPRPGALQPQLHRLALRPQVGRPGRPGPAALRLPPLGPACPGCPVSLRGGQPPPGPAAPHPGPAAVPAGRRAAALVPRAALRPGRRRRLRDARGGPLLLCPARPADAGQQVAPRGQPVRAAPAVQRQGPAARQGPGDRKSVV